MLRASLTEKCVEQSATLGFIVGIEWFTPVDPSTTGRWFSPYNGESYN